jgi:hypothetical protein
MLSTYRAPILIAIVACILATFDGCKKNDSVTNPSSTALYNVTATVFNPQGQPQGGATLALQNPPAENGTFTSITDSTGKATIQSPSGQHTLIASLGTVFQATISVNVSASASGTVVTTPMHLQQNTSLGKVLVVTADAEQLEDVLRVIGYTVFDSVYIDTLEEMANIDSTKVLNYLKQYTLVFSDCDGGTEGDDEYAPLSRTYGRYIQGGGKMYGGHYNYYHLERIWPPYYTQEDNQDNPPADSIRIVSAALAGYVGFTVASWDSSSDSRELSGYEHFTDLPPTSVVYATISWTNPKIAVIVENHLGSGKFLWTDYHNQDIKDVAHLVKIVQYFLLNM